MHRPPDWQPFAHCLKCGCPNIDHVPLRYFLRVCLLHLLPARIVGVVKPLRR